MIETLLQTFTKNQIEIIKAVLYFDVFNYPLTIEELFENSAITISKKEFDIELKKLLEQSILKEADGFILNASANKNHIAKRINGNKGALEVMPLAYKYSRKIASFPFVEGICLSGALSKKYYDEKGDIDYFIITKPNRLWICRTLLILWFKFLPKSKRKYWCVNYFISSNDLVIPDINVFTGTELAYLIPAVNYELYQRLLSENDWYKSRFPNKEIAAIGNCHKTPNPFVKAIIEKILSGKLGTWLDDRLLSFTLKHWQKKYPDLDFKDFELQFRSRKNVCKRHTKGFQNKVLKLWEEKQDEFQTHFKSSLR